MNDRPLPAIPVPYPPADPPCEWCGERPAKPYEVAPPILTTKKQAGPAGKVETVRVMKKRATLAYACDRHRDTFDHRKAEAVKRREQEANDRRKAKAQGIKYRKAAI